MLQPLTRYDGNYALWERGLLTDTEVLATLHAELRALHAAWHEVEACAAAAAMAYDYHNRSRAIFDSARIVRRINAVKDSIAEVSKVVHHA